MLDSDDIESFLHHYIVAALWSTNDESDESGEEPFDANYDESDLAPETLEAMRKDCIAFLEAAQGLINDKTCLRSNQWLGDGVYSALDLAGHDFWLTRCGHGVGFWEDDRWEESAGKKLDALSKEAGEVWLYLGDDGKIYQQ